MSERHAWRALAVVAVGAGLGIAAAPASAAVTAQVKGATLQITGDGASDKLLVQADPSNPANVAVDVGEDGTIDFSFDRATFTAIDINAGGGDDEVRLAGPPLANVTINGGDGNDTLIGGAAAETFNGGAGDDVVSGAQGADVALLGSGDDRFIWNPGDGSDTVEGQGGDDTLDFRGSNIGENIELAPNGSRVRLTRDVAAITMDLNGLERMHVLALGGADTVAVDDLAGTGVKSSDVDLGTADGVTDTVIARGTDGPDSAKVSSANGATVVSGLGPVVTATGGEPEHDLVDVQTLGGDDAILSGVGITGTPVAVDGGDGVDTSTYQGTAGDDAIGIALNGTRVAAFTASSAPVSSATENLLVQGLAGADTITGSNGIAALTALTIDGGAGDDQLSGGDGDDLLVGGGGDDVVDGNRGADVAQLGSGNDTFVWDPGDGSDTVEGQSGRNTLQFNGSNANERIDVAPNGSRVRLTRDVAAITMDLNQIQQVNVRTLGGTDTVSVDDLYGTDVKTTAVDLASTPGTPDGAADTVIANGTDGADSAQVSSDGDATVVSGLGPDVSVTGGDPTLDAVEASTLGGDDTVTSGVGVTGTPVVVVGGEGVDTSIYKGTNAADTIGVALRGTLPAAFTPDSAPVSSATENLLVLGLGGDDTITGGNGIAALTALTVDGGAGDDQLRGGDGDDVMLGGSGNDTVDGNRGADVALLGSGSDTFVWDPGDGSDTVEGQSGNDTLQFNGSNASEQIDISANGTRGRLFRNVAAVTMDFADIQHVGVKALGGNDAITVNDLTGTGVKSADVDLGSSVGAPDATADTVIVDGTQAADRVRVVRSGTQVAVNGLAAQTTVVGSDPFDTLQVNTVGGRDDVAVAADVSDLIQALVDLGADQ